VASLTEGSVPCLKQFSLHVLALSVNGNECNSILFDSEYAVNIGQHITLHGS
jgi:hypothetical protein